MSRTVLAAFALVLMTAYTDAAFPESDIENLRKVLTEQFSTNRHHKTNPGGKRAALGFLNQTLRSYGLQTWLYEFYSDDSQQYLGTNIVAMWPGRNTGTALDRPVVLTANVDTDEGRPGRDDNGSGMTAVVESARLISSQTCVQDHTIFFAVFDFEERSDNACVNGACGSMEFIKNIMQPYVSAYGGEVSKYGGIIVLDSVLNYNNTEMAQSLLNETVFKETPGMADVYEHIKADNYRGNFISAIYRPAADSALHDAFNKKWSESIDALQIRVESPIIPHKNITSIIENQSSPFWQVYQQLILNDVYSFWKMVEDMPAILVTDTGFARGREKDYFQCGPDDNMELTGDRLLFLKKVTDVSTAVLRDKAGTREECRDPTTEAPANFEGGLELHGELTMGASDRRSYSFLVSSFSSSGIVHAMLSNSTWSKALTGRYDGDTHRLLLRPKAVVANDAFDTLLCGMTGNLDKLSDGVLYSGQLTGRCGISGSGQEHITFVLYSKQGALGGGPSLALPVILSLLSSVFVSAMSAWCYYKRKHSDQESKTPILSKGPQSA
ncbi:uncharacterized protein LOC144873004 [Branchiostoma floridae x Branchiostoma japonicum]